MLLKTTIQMYWGHEKLHSYFKYENRNTKNTEKQKKTRKQKKRKKKQRKSNNSQQFPTLLNLRAYI